MKLKSFKNVLGQVVLLSASIISLFIIINIILFGRASFIEPNKFIIFTELVLMLFGVYYGFILLFKREIEI